MKVLDFKEKSLKISVQICQINVAQAKKLQLGEYGWSTGIINSIGLLKFWKKKEIKVNQIDYFIRFVHTFRKIESKFYSQN